MQDKDLEQLLNDIQASGNSSISQPMLPNAGLNSNSLSQYIKQNPGPQVIIGNNPNNTSISLPATNNMEPATNEDESSNESSSKPNISPSDILTRFQDLRKNPTQNPPAVKDVLSKLLGQSNQDLTNAQQSRNQTQLLSMLGQAGNTIGNAFTPLAQHQDTSAFWNVLSKQAEQPINDLSTKQALEQNTLKNNMLQSQASTELSQTDPNSAVSKVMRDLYKQETGKVADSTLTYADIAKMEPALARIAIAKQNILARQDALRAKGDEKQANALKDTQQMIETARGSKDIQNARETARLVDNANSLLAEYPDLNKMPAAQVSLFAQELGKIAKGGVAGEAEVRDIMPHSIASGLMKGLGQLENEPKGSQLAAFLQEYQPYLNTIKNNSNKLVNDRTDRILKVQTPRLGLQNVALMRSVYTPPTTESTQIALAPVVSQTGPHGATVTQGSHTYTWNPATGKYE